MGSIHHTAVLVTGFDKDIKKVHKKAIKLFSKEEVSSIAGEGYNCYLSFMVAPCGSKIGWEPSDIYLVKVGEFLEYLDLINSKDTTLDYVKVSYGDFGLEVDDWRGNHFHTKENL